MKPIGALLLSALVLGGAGVARAQPLLVEVRATSAARAARLAIDGRSRTAWCPDASDRAPLLTVTLPRAGALVSLHIRADHWRAAARLAHTVQVSIDGGEARVVTLAARDSASVELGAPAARSITLAPAGGGRCVPEVWLAGPDERALALVAGVEEAALASLPDVVLELGRALGPPPDEAALARVVRFPITISYDSADHPDLASRFERRVVRDAAALARRVRALGWPSLGDSGEPGVDLADVALALRWCESPAPNEIVLSARGGNENWRLAWTDGAWRLVEVYDNSFDSRFRD